MTNTLKQAWWALLLRGIAAILFALLILFVPGLTLAAGALSFIVLFSAFALVEGIVIIVGAVRREGQWVLLLLLGLISVLAGVLALANPLVFATVSVRLMIAIVAFKALLGGVAEVITALQIRQETEDWGLLMLNGIFALIFGLILVARPITALEVLVLITAFYFLAAGALQLILAFKVRGIAHKVEAVKASLGQ